MLSLRSIVLFAWLPFVASLSEAHSQVEHAKCNFQMSVPEIGNLPAITSGKDATTTYIDTGSSVTIVSPALIANSSPIIGTETGRTFNNPIQLSRYAAQSIASFCGEVELQPYTIQGQELDALDPVLGTFSRSKSILLGRDALTKFNVAIDRVSGFVSATPHAENAHTRDRVKWPYMVKIQIGGAEYACLMDTGFSHRASIYVPASSDISEKLLDGASFSWPSSHPASASGRVTDVYIKNAKVDGLDGDGIVFSVEDATFNDSSNDLTKFCVVGNAFIDRGSLTLSPDKQFARFTGSLPKPAYNRWGITGLSYDVESQKFSVQDLLPHFSAHNAGLIKGDIILKFDDELLTLNNASQLRERAFISNDIKTVLSIEREGKILSVDVFNTENLPDN